MICIYDDDLWSLHQIFFVFIYFYGEILRKRDVSGEVFFFPNWKCDGICEEEVLTSEIKEFLENVLFGLFE